ncbi:MAG: hypothetical protein KF824_11775 [Fimbriimonadaceae bacterium]|nr:MAG: hypothetical protein KF824_11775 [Fimbriimonadaceae bacterium]
MKATFIMLPMLLTFAPSANAATAFNNLGPGDTFSTAGESLSFTEGGKKTAFQFTSLTSGQITQIVLALSAVAGDPLARVTLYSDTNNNVGTEIAHWDGNVPPSLPDATNPAYSFGNTNTNAILLEGNRYWISSEALAPNTTLKWNYNPLEVQLLNSNYSYNNPGWQTFAQITGGGMRIETVPEPSAIGLVGMVLLRKKTIKRK